MPALVLIGYWALFTGITFVALQYLPRKPIKAPAGSLKANTLSTPRAKLLRNRSSEVFVLLALG